METYVWILQVVLALFFIMPGIMKLKLSKKEMVERGNITQDQSVYFPRFIGIAEVSGVIVLVLSIWLKALEPLAGLAAVGFTIVMVGAIWVHANKKEWKLLPILVLALALSVTVAVVHV